MNTLTNKLKKAAKHCNLLSNKILGKVALTATSITTVGLIALTIHGFSQLPPFVQRQWDRWRVGPNTAEMDRLAALPPEQISEINRIASNNGYRDLSDAEKLICEGNRNERITGRPALLTAWRTMNPNRPLEASVKEEFVKSLGKTWRQQYGTSTCSFHTAEAIIRHKLTKNGAALPDWDAEDTAKAFKNSPNYPLQNAINYRKANLKARTISASYIATHLSWVPVIIELIKQEIAAGRPVIVTTTVPGASFVKKHGNILKAPREYPERPPSVTTHELVVVSYKEPKDGIDTEWEVWNPAGPTETHGIMQASDGLLIYTLDYTIQSVE